MYENLQTTQASVQTALARRKRAEEDMNNTARYLYDQCNTARVRWVCFDNKLFVRRVFLQPVLLAMRERKDVTASLVDVCFEPYTINAHGIAVDPAGRAYLEIPKTSRAIRFDYTRGHLTVLLHADQRDERNKDLGSPTSKAATEDRASMLRLRFRDVPGLRR